MLENKLLREELAIIELKREKISEMEKDLEEKYQRKLSKSKKYNMLNDQLSINLSRTKRKLQIGK